MKRLLGVGLVAVAMIGANVAQATTWAITFDRLNGASIATADTYAPTPGYMPAQAAGAWDATGFWNVFNPDTRGKVFDGGSGTWGGNFFDGTPTVGYGGDASGVPLYDVTGATAVKWMLDGAGETSMWLPRYGTDLASDYGKVLGNNKGIGGADGARNFYIKLSGLTVGNTFAAYMFGASVGAEADTVNLSVVGGTSGGWNNTGAYTSRGALVSGTVGVGGTVILHVTDTHGAFASGLVFKSGAGDPEVPEPGTWLLLGGSLLGLCVGGFRRLVRK